MTSQKMILGVFRDQVAAQNCLDALYAHGYTTQDINVLMSEQTHRTHFLSKEPKEATRDTMGLEGVGVGGAIGTAVGASLAAIAAIGSTLVIPGLNLILAGPIVAALAGGGAGAVAGGIIGGLTGLGIPEETAESYHEALSEGGTIIGVRPRHTESESDEVDEVTRIMEACAGQHVHTTTVK